LSIGSPTKSDPAPDQLVEQAQERFGLQDYYGCVHLLEDVIQSGQGYADAYQLLGVALHLVGQPDRALEALETAVELNPRYVEALIHRGLVLNDLGRAEEAAASFAAANDSGGELRGGIPQHHAAKLANQHAELGEAYAEAGALPEAIQQYRDGLNLGPTFHDLRYRLARLLIESGRALEAKEEMEIVVAARPGFVEAKAGLGMACYMAGDGPAAARIWTEIVSEHPEDLKARAYLAMLHRNQIGNES
jgi:tetratricopeptide (TPR) repeat protein